MFPVTHGHCFRFAPIEVERTMAMLAMTDAPTKLPNRRRMREILEAGRVRSHRGGEELLFLVPETDLAGAQTVAEKLRDAAGGTV